MRLSKEIKNSAMTLEVLAIGEPQDWKYPFAKERADFVRRFYDYAKEHPRGEKILWSEWLQQ